MRCIIACDPKGGIGYKNKLPWSKIQGDLPRFKKLTDNCVLVMGRKTWESLPVKPLPNRTNLILTSQLMPRLPFDAFTISNLENITQSAWIIGGATLINSNWDKIHEIHLTRLFTEYNCDTFIDMLTLEKEFICVSKEEHTDHNYEIWKRK